MVEIANHEYGNIFALSVLGAIKQFQRAAIFDQIILYRLKFDQMSGEADRNRNHSNPPP